MSLVRRWLLDVVDDDDIDRAFGGFELETQLFLDGGEDVGAGLVRRCGP